MDLCSFDNVKEEKASAMRRYNRLHTITRLFRLTELCIAAVLLSWTFTRLPFALCISLDYLCLFSGVVSRPLFVFLVCKAIIVSLFAKSRNVTASASPRDSKDDVETQLYDEFTNNCGGMMSNSGNDVLSTVKEEVVYQDKQIISEALPHSSVLFTLCLFRFCLCASPYDVSHVLHHSMLAVGQAWARKMSWAWNFSCLGSSKAKTWLNIIRLVELQKQSCPVTTSTFHAFAQSNTYHWTCSKKVEGKILMKVG